MTDTPDLFIVTPPTRHPLPAGRRVLVASANRDLQAAVVEALAGLWPDDPVALYLWQSDEPDALGWLLDHLLYCETAVLDLDDAGLAMLAGRHLGRGGLLLHASDTGADALVGRLHPTPVFHQVEDLILHLKAANNSLNTGT